MLIIKFQDFKNLKSTILQEIENNNDSKKMEGIELMWLLLKIFITSLKVKEIYQSNLLIILDQYNCDEIDVNYREINEISLLIEQYNKCTLFYEFKLLVIISINNYDTKNMFLESLQSTYLDFKNSLVSNITKIDSKNNIKENKNYEILNIENFLDKKIEKIYKSYNERILKIVSGPNSDSSCFLFNRYFSQTRIEYFNYICNCKKLLNENIGKNFLHCIKKFNFSLKYYQLLLEFKNKNRIFKLYLQL